MDTQQNYDSKALATSLNEPAAKTIAYGNDPEYIDFWRSAAQHGPNVDIIGHHRYNILHAVELFFNGDYPWEATQALHHMIDAWMDSKNVDLKSASDRVTLYQVQAIINLLAELSIENGNLKAERIRCGALVHLPNYYSNSLNQ